MRMLTPLTLQDRYFIAIEAEIQRIFDKLIYKPLIDILGMRMHEFRNAGEPLIDAISLGKVWYIDGQFKGKFNARITLALLRIGAKYDARTRGYALAREKLPADVSMAQASADAKYIELRRQILLTLDNIDVQNVDLISKAQEEYKKSVAYMEKDLDKTVLSAIKKAPPTAKSRITIEANLTSEQKEQIAADWGENLDLYIKKWTQSNILKLRSEIQPHVLAGGRAQGLVKVIQENYQVGARKAKFLARQETALLMAKFQETRYAGMGITRYRWSDSHDKRVRHDHHELNGQVFSFTSPPVSNRKTGARNNPGQDYGCRCVAIPIVE